MPNMDQPKSVLPLRDTLNVVYHLDELNIDRANIGDNQC